MGASRAIKLFGGVFGGTSLSLYTNYRWQLRNDRVLNPRHLDVLDHIAEHKDNHNRVPRWETRDSRIKALARHFPTMPINHPGTTPNPDPQPISILSLNDAPPAVKKHFDDSKAVFVAAGGPSAHIEVFQRTVEKQQAVLVTNKERHRKPANHIQTDAVNETPAYTAGKTVAWFIKAQLKEVLFPSRFDRDVPKPGFNVFNLNTSAWLKNPSCWAAGFKVAWGNFKLSRQYDQQMAAGFEPYIWDYTRARMKRSREYLEAANAYLATFDPSSSIFRTTLGSITLAADKKATQGNQADSKLFAAEGLKYHRVVPAEAKTMLGFIPYGAHSLWADHHNRVVHDNFLETLRQHIAQNNSVLHGNVQTIYADPNQQGGVVVVKDSINGQSTLIKYNGLTLSLGNTAYLEPNARPMIGVAGISSDILVLDQNSTAETPESVPLVIDGPNHLIEMERKMVPDTHPITGEAQQTLAIWYRYTTGGDVEPVVASDGSFHPRHAAHMLHRLSKTLPLTVEIAPIQMGKCVRLIGPTAHQNERKAFVMVDNKKVKLADVTIIDAAGGGGLTAMGAQQSSAQVDALRAATHHLKLFKPRPQQSSIAETKNTAAPKP